MTAQKRRVDERGRVVLPAGFAGKMVEITVEGDGSRRIAVAQTYRNRPKIGPLVAAITENNRHREGVT